MLIIDELLTEIAPRAAKARGVDVRIGAHWTIAAFEVAGKLCAGLSSTLAGTDKDHHHGGRVPVRHAGNLLTHTPEALAALAHSESLPEASVGLATINALLEVDESTCVTVNAAEVIAKRGKGRKVAIVGHFPFVGRVRDIAETLWVLELNPRQGDVPADQAENILPQADVVALTGTSLLNHTFDTLIHLCRPDAFVIMLGGTTPMSSSLLNRGVDAVAGTLVVDPHAAMLAVSQGATFKQIPGKRLLVKFGR